MDEASDTRWPVVVGTISLLYAILGLTCSLAFGAWSAMTPYLPEMMRGGATIPPVLRITTMVQALLGAALAIMLLVGAIGLQRRRPSSVPLLQRWVVARLGLALLGAGILLATGPTQLQVQRSVIEYQNRAFREADMAQRVKETTDEQLWRSMIRNAAIMTGVTLVFPVALGFYLSRRTIAEQTSQWDHS